MAQERAFDVRSTDDRVTGSTLIVGQSHLGLAGVTAADYLVRHLESEQAGHVATSELPAITPFEEGVPRHHSRLYDVEAADLTVLVGELFVPVTAARAYTDALMSWAADRDVDEIAILHGVPFPHGPEEHEVFHVATPAYRDRRLEDDGFGPLKGGFLDGVIGELLTRSLDDDGLETGVFVTPAHPPGSDVEAALKLLDALESIYGLDVDETELRELGDQLRQYHEQLAERMQAAAEGEAALGSHDYPIDRMYM